MIALKLLLIYHFSFANVCAGAHTTRTTLGNSTSHSTNQIQSIQQCIWDHGIFCIMLDFLHYQSPSSNEGSRYNSHVEWDDAELVDPLTEDCSLASFDSVEGASPYTSDVVKPSTVFRHIATAISRPTPQQAHILSVHGHEPRAQIDLTKRLYDLSIQFVPLLVSVYFMASLLYELWNRIRKLCHSRRGPSGPQNSPYKQIGIERWSPRCGPSTGEDPHAYSKYLAEIETENIYRENDVTCRVNKSHQ